MKNGTTQYRTVVDGAPGVLRSREQVEQILQDYGDRGFAYKFRVKPY